MRIALLLALTLPLSGCWATAYTAFVMGSFAVVDEQQRQHGIAHHPSITLDSYAPRWAPPMDENRKVKEQDCSKPIVDYSANLVCR